MALLALFHGIWVGPIILSLHRFNTFTHPDTPNVGLLRQPLAQNKGFVDHNGLEAPLTHSLEPHPAEPSGADRELRAALHL